MPEDNGKSDLKKRLGRRRMRTASKKGLETQATPENSSSTQGTPSMPSSEMPSVSMPVSSADPGISGEQAPVAGPDGGVSAPAPAPEIDFSKFAKGGSNKLMYIVATVTAVLGLGLGYCGGHRVEQNKLANMSRKDAKNILTDISNVQLDFNQISSKFNSRPAKLSDWSSAKFPKTILKPDLSVAGRSKLTWIPKPSKRKEFMKNLITYYGLIIALNDEYNFFSVYLETMLEPHKSLFKDLDAVKGKNLREKLAKYKATLKKEMKAKLEDKKATKFIVLMEGSPQKAVIVPYIAAKMRCPSNPNNCACDPAKKPKKGQPCVRKCNPNCQSYEKVYYYNKREYNFNPAINKDLKFGDSKVAVKFESIAPKSIGFILKHEIDEPVMNFYKWANIRFGMIRKIIKKIEKIPGSLLKTLGDAANRKKRGMI